MRKFFLTHFILPLLFIFVIAYLWEFWVEDFFNFFIGLAPEPDHERWEYVITALIMTMLALSLPTILGLRNEHRRKQSERNLQKITRRLLRAQEIAHLGDWELNPESNELMMSDVLFTIFDLPPPSHPLTLTDFLRLIPHENRQVCREIFSAPDSPAMAETIHSLSFPSRESKWLRVRRQSISDVSGTGGWIYGTIQDITAQKQSEITARQQEEFLKLILDSIQDGISVVDLDLNIVRANSTVRKWCGIDSESDLVGRKCHEIYRDGGQPCSDCPVIRTISTGKPDLGEKPLIGENGNSGVLEIFSFPILDKTGKITGAVEFLHDITREKKTENEKLLLENQLRQAQKMEAIGTLAGGIAHDFNNILTIILGYLELSLDELPGDSPARNDLDNIFQAANRAKDLVRQILSFSRKSEQEIRPILPQSIIKETAKLLSSTIPSTIEVRQDIARDCPVILADPTQLHQVLLDLATNAIHAMDEKGVLTISLQVTLLSENDLRNHPEHPPGLYVKLSVGDTGCGIPPEIAERMFEPFFTTKEIGSGTGMGLSVVHGIVTAHRGLIKYETEPGRGTIFNLFFPVAEMEEDVPSAPVEDLPRGQERVLVVDDEEMIARLTARILANLGYQAHFMTNSTEALATFTATPNNFDLVITDQSMPGMSGMELARKILAIKPDQPIILCTGYSSKVSEEGARQAGIKALLTKPIEKMKIALAARDALDL